MASSRLEAAPYFRVIDLGSQADAVARHVRGWSRDEVLAWLSRYGKVKQLHTPYDVDTYSFLAPSGLQTGFILREDGEFLILVDHTTYRPSGKETN